jgi:hypothetical protein
MLFRLNFFSHFKLKFRKFKNQRVESLVFLFLLLLFIVNLNSCATYQGKVSQAKRHIIEKNWEQALKELEPLALQPSDDQLVYLLDYATTLQMSENYKESNKYFIQADKLSDIKEF